MVTEIRHLIFQNGEVVQALAAFQKQRRDPLPAGTIAGLSFAKESRIKCTLEWDADGGGTRGKRTFLSDELGAALIHYCISKRIPLPAKSPKVLQLFGENIGLVVSINLSSDALRRLQDGG